MAIGPLLYLGALESIGIQPRMVSLVKANGVDTHATVEVLIDGDWVVIDPTFNVYFVIEGKPASAMELHQLFLKNADDLEVAEGGQVLSSAPYDSPGYLLDYYNSVSIYERRHFFAWQALPPLQYFYGVAVAVLDDGSGTIDRLMEVRELMVLAYNFVFPLGFAVSAIVFVATARHLRKLPKKQGSQNHSYKFRLVHGYSRAKA